jgi:uncharacterized membrane protein YeaQ/YmgE (transglycosylase-associated protein family)
MIGAIILGLLAGFIAKALMPGKDPGGFFVTILLGLAGSLVGFFLFTSCSASATTRRSTSAASWARSSAR